MEYFFTFATLSCDYLHEFSKKFETALMYTQGLGETDPWKNQKLKILRRCPFKY